MRTLTLNNLFDKVRTVKIRNKKFKCLDNEVSLARFGKDDLDDAYLMKSIMAEDEEAFNGKGLLKLHSVNAAYLLLSSLAIIALRIPGLVALTSFYEFQVLAYIAAYTYRYALTKVNSKNMKKLDKELEGEREIRELQEKEESICRQIENYESNSQSLKASGIRLNCESVERYLEKNNIDKKYAKELIDAGVFDAEVGYNSSGYERIFIHYFDDKNELVSCLRDFRGYSFMKSKYDIEESEDKIIVSENSFVRDEFHDVVGTRKNKTWYYDKNSKTVFEKSREFEKKKLEELKEQLISVKRELSQKNTKVKPMKLELKNGA